MSDYAIDLNGIAEREGIRVRYDKGERLDSGLDGMIRRLDDGSVEIIINAVRPETRQRFTLAHELGHYFLGHLKEIPCFRDSTKSYDVYHYDPKEVAANRAAAALLMPEKLVRHLILDKGVNRVSELARLLNVSEQAMRIRLKQLGIISNG
ncbi:MAG TPA: ImmA/IrrE family metallo-endopeptidase [Piscirickettsiaceae bacterium]|nr:ImmA/IrrE family metallo-endopeptidase [Piscirickettsiaceae bacterium]